MSLTAGCPRCPAPVADRDGGWWCPDHGRTSPLWRPEHVDYHAFTEHLARAADMPTLLPWPLSPGWVVTDFGCVTGPGEQPRACFVTCTGTSEPDGVVQLTLVSEEPAVGLGARFAGTVRSDPGAEIGDGPPHAKVRLENHPIPLWSVLTSDRDATFDRSVFAGEAHGRWLWLVLRPASAALLLENEWSLLDVGDLGPELVDLPFTDGPAVW